MSPVGQAESSTNIPLLNSSPDNAEINSADSSEDSEDDPLADEKTDSRTRFFEEQSRAINTAHLRSNNGTESTSRLEHFDERSRLSFELDSHRDHYQSYDREQLEAA